MISLEDFRMISDANLNFSSINAGTLIQHNNSNNSLNPKKK